MNTPTSTNESIKGFSAVELLVTLFIAVIFLAAGYSLYGAIVSNSAATRHRAQADNIAYEYLRRYESTVTNPCVTTTPLNNAAVTGDSGIGLPSPTVTVNITCPNSTVTLLSLVKVTIGYKEGGSQRNVYHEVFASTQ
jgi:prepilin-type N-terminal cleavage/methylation domain-containing protein